MILLLRGGLGNQLFIYGAYKYFSSLNYSVKIDDTYGFKNDYRYKRKNQLFFYNLKYKKIKNDISLIWRIINRFKVSSNYLGFSNCYFQESKYLDYVDIDFSRNVDRICIHVRIKDYPLKLEETDYIIMVRNGVELFPNYPIYIITDDLKYLKKNMRVLSAIGQCMELSEHDSFNFIAESSVTILSDSSFSFCSAYLGMQKVIIFKRFTNIINNGLKQHKWISY